MASNGLAALIWSVADLLRGELQAIGTYALTGDIAII